MSWSTSWETIINAPGGHFSGQRIGVWRRLLLGLLPIVTLVLAAYLRLNHLGWTEFKLDEANLSRLALNLVRGVKFPLAGIGSSTGIVNLPLAAWLMAIPYAISSNPIVATGFVAVLNVIAVAGCYGLARRWLSEPGGSASAVRRLEAGDASHRGASYKTAALLATLLFAVAPWAVIHSRKIWAQDLLPPFVIAWAWTGWLALVKSRPRAWVGHALTLAACIHLHFSGLWLLPVTLVWAIAFARRWMRSASAVRRPFDSAQGRLEAEAGDASYTGASYMPAVAAIAVFAATFAPFVIADALRGGPNLNRLLEIARQPAVVDDQALRLAWLMITGQEIHSLAGPQEFEHYLASVPGGETGFTFGGFVGVLTVVGALAALTDVVGAVRRRSFDDRSAASLMMLSWLALPVLLQSRHGLPLFTHYFLILYPVSFLLVGSLYARLLGMRAYEASTFGESASAVRRLAVRWLEAEAGDVSYIVGRVGRWGLVAFAVIIAVLQSIQTIALQTFVASRATPGGHGVPLETTMRLVDEIVQANRDMNGAEALIYTEGDDPFVHERPAALDVLLPPDVPRRFVDLGQAVTIYPRDASIIVWYSPQGLALPDDLADQSPLRRQAATVPLRLGEAAAQVFGWPGQAATSPPCNKASPLGQWTNDVTLLDVRPSGAWRKLAGWIELCYRVGTVQRQADAHWFNHLIGPDGRHWAQVDGPGYPTRSWRAGDVIRARFGPFNLPADAPSGRYAVRIGMYTYPEVVNVPTVEAAGNPAGDSVTVDLGDPIR